MANIQLLQGTEKIKDSYTKINTSVTNLNNAKLEKSGDTMTGNLAFSGSLRGFDFRNGNNATVADLVNFPEATDADVVIRIFRNTNTTGRKIFAITKGDGTTAYAFSVINGIIDMLNSLNVTITAYAGNPNGNIAAPPGSICLDTANGAVYRKASGSGNTGWQAMA